MQEAQGSYLYLSGMKPPSLDTVPFPSMLRQQYAASPLLYSSLLSITDHSRLVYKTQYNLGPVNYGEARTNLT